jgi:hypothetical protein
LPVASSIADVGALRVAVEDSRQEIVDGDVAGDGLPRKPGDETHEPGARAIRQAELQLRHLHAARDDIDDAAEAARHHAVHREPHHFDWREHHRVERGDPLVPRPIAEIAGSWAGGIVEEDIGLWTGGKGGSASGAGGDIGGNRGDLDAGCRRNLRSSLVQRLALTRDDGHVDPFPSDGAGVSQTAARAAQQRLSSTQSEVHIQPVVAAEPSDGRNP